MPDGFIPGLNWTTGTAAAPLTTPSFNLYKTARNCRHKNKTILNTSRTGVFKSNTGAVGGSRTNNMSFIYLLGLGD